MSKVISTTNAFLQTDFNGYVENFKENAIQKGWNGNSFTSFQVEVSGMTLSCQANQRMRATPMSIEFNKSVLPVVNSSNNVFFVRDTLAAPPTLTPVTIPIGNVSCVGDGSVPTDQVPNSLAFAINKGLNNANPAWGVAGNIHVTVENGYTINDTNLIGNIKFNSGGPGLTVDFICIRDTNFPEGQSVYNRSAHNLLGMLVNEVHFDLPLTAFQINALYPCNFAIAPTYEICGRPPVRASQKLLELIRDMVLAVPEYSKMFVKCNCETLIIQGPNPKDIRKVHSYPSCAKTLRGSGGDVVKRKGL